MIDPKHIEKIKHANKTQCEVVFDNMKKLYINMNDEDLKQRLHMFDKKE
jgi:competence transcription factor ComK